MRNLLICCVLIAVFQSQAALGNNSNFDFMAKEVKVLKIKAETRNPIFRHYNLKPSEQPVSVSDPKKIAGLIAAFEKGKIVDGHKCGPLGYLSFILKNGKTVEIAYLPGHEEEFYEFIYDTKFFRLDRKAFLKVMINAGMPLDYLIVE